MVEFLKRLMMYSFVLIVSACATGQSPLTSPDPVTEIPPQPSPIVSPSDPNEFPNEELIVEFELVLGSAQRDRGIDVIQTRDGGFAILGYTSSQGVGGEDVYLVRIDANGGQLWSQTYGGEDKDNGWSVIEAENGDLVLFGFTRSFGAGGLDFYLVRTDSSGHLLWERTYGGLEDEYGWDLSPTSDGGFVLAGQTESYGNGGIDGYLIKVDQSGEQQWSQTFGGPYEDRLYSIDLCDDGGFILTGTSGESSNRRNVYLVRTNAQGEILWERRIGGEEDDVGHDVRELEDGAFAVAGYTMNFGAQRYDAMLLKVDDQGEVVWRRLYGSFLDDRTISLDITGEGDFLLGGYSQSYGNGNWDVYLILADTEGDMLWFGIFGDLGNDTGYTFILTDEEDVLVTGETYGSNIAAGDLLILKIGMP